MLTLETRMALGSGAPTRLRCEYLDNPIGIDDSRPRLAWWLDDDRPAELQTAYHVLAASAPELLESDQADLWDSGRVESSETCHVAYGGAALGSRQRVWWKVRTFDSDGVASTWSRLAFFEMGLLVIDEWHAAWIATPLMGGKRTAAQVPALRRAFDLSGTVERARLYVTALGVYDFEINGHRVIDTELVPGWTDFRKRVRYQVVDVTRFLRTGRNVMGALLGDGWYCGRLGLSERQQYGDRPEFLAQLEIVLADGTQRSICTDAEWRWQRSPILSSDLLEGESVDGRQRLGAWTTPDYDAASWYPVAVQEPRNIRLDATMSALPKVVDELMPVGEPSRRVGELGRPRFIYDLGQNMVGRVRVVVKARRGTHVTLRFAERLDAKGDLHTANLRDARATDCYTCAGEAEGETFEPRFTFHGFQFVEVSGDLQLEDIQSLTGVVISSALTETGHFQCDHPLVNQLQSNIVWSQRGNFLDVPTDCPQRDERLGWTGDAQMFVRTAAFNQNVAAFFAKWMTDVVDAQRTDGSVPPVAPLPPGQGALHMDGGPAWADAIVICPWTVYRCFGDRRALERHYAAMTAFVANLEQRFPDLIRADARIERWQGFGDWLATDGAPSGDQRFGNTPKDLIGTAFFCYSAKLLARIAGVLGNLSDLERYEDLAQRVRAAFRRRFVSADGRLVGETQTSYVLALHFGLLDERERAPAVEWLVADIESRRWHLSTGFVGTPYLLHVLTNHGHLDVAYRLLLQTSAPSWLYPVTQGATTIWERWDGWTEEHGFQDAAMNSFNHYAYGAVGEWLYGTLAGLELDADLAPRRNAYRCVRVQPRPPLGQAFKARFPGGPPLHYVGATLETMVGRYEVSWEISGARFRLKAAVPPNCRATIVLPDGDVRQVASGRHELSMVIGDGAEDGIPVLSNISQIAS